MNDSEIIKALECCTTTKGGCKECPMKGYEKVDCQLITATEACKLIKRQQEEIERLNIDLKAMRGAANSWKAEVQRICKKEFDNIEIDIETVKSTAVKEFAESLKRKSELVAPSVWAIPYRAVAVVDIDKLLEERGCNDG